MKPSRQLTVAALLTVLFAQQATADIVTPANAQATSQFGLGIEVGRLIDGSGLDAAGELHDNSNANMWFSGCADAGIPGGTPVDCPTGFEAGPVNEQIVEFTLEASHNLSKALVWQYNELSDIGPLPARGVKSFEMLASPTATGDNFVSLGEFELEVAQPPGDVGEFTEPAQDLDISGSPGANGVRRVRFRVIENHGDETYVGLSEVKFDGARVAAPTVPATSPTGLILFGVGLLAVGWFALRRRIGAAGA